MQARVPSSSTTRPSPVAKMMPVKTQRIYHFLLFNMMLNTTAGSAELGTSRLPHDNFFNDRTICFCFYNFPWQKTYRCRIHVCRYDTSNPSMTRLLPVAKMMPVKTQCIYHFCYLTCPLTLQLVRLNLAPHNCLTITFFTTVQFVSVFNVENPVCSIEDFSNIQLDQEKRDFGTGQQK